MSESYLYIEDLRERARVPENGILSQTIHEDGRTKVVLFGFAPGQELSAHTAPYPAMLAFVKGDATLRLGAEEHPAKAGTFVYMPALLEHGIRAETEVVLLLTLLKPTA
jgi:quercetin dioxygenase-like cupin family protein